MTEAHHRFVVAQEDSGQRLDQWLGEQAAIGSRARAQKLIASGRVLINGSPAKNSQRTAGGDLIELALPAAEPAELIPSEQPLDVRYEDEDLLVIHKPSGLVMHPAPGHSQDTLVNILLHHVKKLSVGFGPRRPGIVHRLDRDTSGLLVIAKNDRTHRHLAQQFQERTVQRGYWAVVFGHPASLSGEIRSSLARHPTDRKRYASTDRAAHGRLAITNYHVRQRHPAGLSLVECHLQTGRTHQIRVHLSELGHPVVGDPLYLRPNRIKGLKGRTWQEQAATTRLALHAFELGFHRLDGEQLYFTAGWPPDIKPFVEALDWI